MANAYIGCIAWGLGDPIRFLSNLNTLTLMKGFSVQNYDLKNYKIFIQSFLKNINCVQY